MLCLCEGRSEVGVELLELLLGGRGDLLVFGDLVNEARGHGWEGCTELGLEAATILDGNLVKVSTDTSEQDDNLLCNLHHALDLGCGSDTGHGKTDVNGRADSRVEKL